jgi:hypothetical protein
VGRTGILAASLAMAQIETLEFALDLEGNLAAQTGSHILHADTSKPHVFCRRRELKGTGT